MAMMFVTMALSRGTPDTFWIVIRAAIDMTYGTRLVTTARLTTLPNCSLSSGLMVIKARAS